MSLAHKHIVYFGQTPGQGTGSPITLLRHLRRFAAMGWKVSVVPEWGGPTATCEAEGWRVEELPHRKKWWPPYRPGNALLRATRMRLWAEECVSRFKADAPTVILTYLNFESELISEVAAYYSRRTGIPMTTIIHDDALVLGKHSPEKRGEVLKRFQWILTQSHQNWFVSGPLAEAYGFKPEAGNVLLPIPEGITHQSQWRAEFAEKPVIIYAGYIYPQQYGLLANLARVIDAAGGRLMLLSRETPGLRELANSAPLDIQPLLPTNRDAFEFVARRAAAFLAAYSEKVEEMPWVRSSYPSKVVEFSHLGLPILFVAPAESAIFSWNQQRDIPYNLRPEDLGRVTEFVNALKVPSQWEALAKPIRHLAQTEFDPAFLQQRVLDGLF